MYHLKSERKVLPDECFERYGGKEDKLHYLIPYLANLIFKTLFENQFIEFL